MDQAFSGQCRERARETGYVRRIKGPLRFDICTRTPGPANMKNIYKSRRGDDA